MIWDLHCHLSGVDGNTPDERIAQLMTYADRMGVDRLVFYMGYPFLVDPTPEQLAQQNDQVLQALTHWHDRAFGFTYVSAKYAEESLAEIDRCIANGPMVGIKLWVAAKCSDEQIDPIIKRCAELKAAIFQHTWYKVGGNLPGESTPADVARMAARHPETPLICGHTGGDWELGIRAVRGSPNVSIGIAGSDPCAGFVEMAVRELGPERVIYGSDIGGRSFASQLAKVTGAAVPESAKRLILGQNLRRMLLPILREKGVRID
ncbi:MAG: amidohydrolase [Planctomycetota bacterium]|nr:MAG: amidohydrolase [Planctomycetota bacterium]REJ96255.1 MAG: amidohydrolase [Planctomycetota bacterium]